MIRLLVCLVLVIGCAARIAVWAVNPPGNAYDDHLTAVHLYATTSSRPAIDDCWQCYQPPLYYTVAATVFGGARAVGLDVLSAWKAVQLLSALASCATLLVCWRILRPMAAAPALVALSIVAFVPRALYTAGAASNDAFLILWSSIALWGFVRCYESTTLRLDRPWAVAGVAAGALAAALTKQSGLVVGCLPLWLLGHAFVRRRRSDQTPAVPMWSVAILALATALMPADELWRAAHAGRFLASNQHLYGEALSQPPGSVAAVSFFDLRLAALWREPRLGPETVDAFWSQLYARMWCDYEPRYLRASTASLLVFRALLVLGLVPLALVLVGAGRTLALRADRLPGLAVSMLAAGFIATPLVQTLRFPYYSSMKALFVMPAIAAIAYLAALGTEFAFRWRPSRWIVAFATVLLAVAALLHAALLVWEVNRELVELSGPIWPLPGRD